MITAKNRIVIGDVGSGKTMVAFFVAINFIRGLKNSAQVVLLAPTEVLAYQHYQSLIAFFQANKENILWQKSKLKNVQLIYLSGKKAFLNDHKITRKSVLELIKNSNKENQIWIGTQALLFQEKLTPNLVLIDEQHRFGVKQRQKLNTQSLSGSHFVSFTATPIPRTLALTVYDELEPVFLEKLNNRKPIETILIKEKSNQIKEKIEYHLAKKRKVYILVPAVENKENKDDTRKLWTVDQAFDWVNGMNLGTEILKVHGKQKTKTEILEQFKSDPKANILVATSVIEVGVDVSDASLMLIFNPETFGLAALHQLRGRIGRNDFEDNQCLLVTRTQYLNNPRLNFLSNASNGFEIAEKDLELRGSGNLTGVEQSGFDTELEELMGLDPESYIKLNELAKTSVKNLTSLPRLEKYIQSELDKIWRE